MGDKNIAELAEAAKRAAEKYAHARSLNNEFDNESAVKDAGSTLYDAIHALAAQVAAEQAESPTTPKAAPEACKPASPELAYSTSEDGRFTDDWSSLIDSLLCDHEHLSAGLPYYVGEKREWKPSDFVHCIEDTVLDDMREQAWQEADEWSEGFAENVSGEAKAALTKAIRAWADEHLRCDFYTVEKVREARLTAEEAAEADPGSAVAAPVGKRHE